MGRPRPEKPPPNGRRHSTAVKKTHASVLQWAVASSAGSVARRSPWVGHFRPAIPDFAIARPQGRSRPSVAREDGRKRPLGRAMDARKRAYAGNPEPCAAALGPRNGVPATRASRGAPRGDERMFYVALIVDLGDDDAGRGIDQQQAVVDDHVSVRAYGRHRGGHRLRHRGERVSIADPRADGIGVAGPGGRIDDALARHRRRRNRLGHDPLAHDRPAAAPLRYDRAINRGALGGRERKRRRAHRRLIGARLVGRRLVGPRLVIARLITRLVVARLITRLIDLGAGDIRLINPGLRARRYRRGNERYSQTCGADIRRHGDLLCQLGEALVNAARGSNVPPAGNRAPTAKSSLRLRDVTWTPQPADIRDAGARKMHLGVSFLSNSV